MPLPKQVEEAGKRADELAKEVYEKTEPNNPEPGPAPEPSKAEPEPAPAPEPTEDWKHKFEVLQGKYNKETKQLREDAADIGRLRQENVSLSQQVVELSRSISELNSKISEMQNSKPSPAPAPEPTLTDEDKEYLRSQDLDDRTVQILVKAAGFNPNKTVDSKLADEVTELKSSVAETNQKIYQRNYADFITAVRNAIENFDAVNNDPGFINWLSQPVSPHTPDMTRNDVLQKSAQIFDSVRAIKLFNEFIEQNKPAPAPEPEPKPKSNKLENEIEPASSAASDPSQIQPKGPTYTNLQVKQFYEDMATSAGSNWSTGKWAGKKDECLAMDRDIQKAANEGRITIARQ